MKKITQKDLLQLDKKELAIHLMRFLNTLSIGKRRKWIKENLPKLLNTKPVKKDNPKQLLKEIDEFAKESYSGSYVSYVDGNNWSYENTDNDDYSNFEAWTDTFTELLTKTINISKQSEHKVAVKCFDKLFKLLQSATDTTDIVGNYSVIDNIYVNFSDAIACYTQSLLKTKNNFEEVIDIIAELAKRYSYYGGYNGLVKVLNYKQRKILLDRLWQVVEAKWKNNNGSSLPEEVYGLIAISEAENNIQEVLSIKERFAKVHRGFLKDILDYYEKNKDWETVEKWAKVGLNRFGQDEEILSYLVKAEEKLGNKEVVLDAKVDYFFENPSAEIFEEIREYANSISKWPKVYEKILVEAQNKDKFYFDNPGLKIKLLLAEGNEKEAFEYFNKNHKKFEMDIIKLIAKYSLIRIVSTKDLSNYKELNSIYKRHKTEESDLYKWLRIALKNPPTLKENEYINLCIEMHKLLIDFHLNSGKSSRVNYAGYYCSVIKELSDFLNDTTIWSNFIQYMRYVYQKKKLIWKNLKDRGLIE